MPGKALLISLLFGVSCTASAGQVYRWVDDAGVVHFSDRPAPPGKKPRDERVVDVTPTNTEPPDPESRRRLIRALQQRGVRIIYHSIPGPQPNTHSKASNTASPKGRG